MLDLCLHRFQQTTYFATNIFFFLRLSESNDNETDFAYCLV